MRRRDQRSGQTEFERMGIIPRRDPRTLKDVTYRNVPPGWTCPGCGKAIPHGAVCITRECRQKPVVTTGG